MRRAQIKMFETIGVLVVFFFLLVSGTVFYFHTQESAMKKELARQAQLMSLQAAQRAMFLPELDCSFVSVQRESCFDKLKLEAFGQVVIREPGLRESYFGMFGFATINVRQVYPETSQLNVTLYENRPDEYARTTASISPVLLYDPVSRTSSFGLMEVTTYAEQ